MLSVKPSRTTFRDRMTEMISTLRKDIMSGKFQSGDYLPSINQLSEQYQLSKNSVQKGLNELVEEALIERLPRVGIRVRGPEDRGLIILRFGYYPSLIEEASLDQLIEQFHVLYPHIRVQLIPLQYEDYYEFVNHYLEDGMLDVISINQIHYNQFVSKRSYERFEPVSSTTDIYPFLTHSFTTEQQMRVQPFIFSPVVMCYNQQHFAENGLSAPPDHWTWEEFMTLLEHLQVKSEQRLPFYFYPATNHRWPIFVLQSGQFDPASQEQRSLSSLLMDSIEICYKLIHQQSRSTVLLSESEANVEELFKQGKVSVMMTTYFGLNQLRDVDFPYDLAPLPFVHHPKTLLLTIGLAMNRNGKHKEAARQLVEFLLSQQAQLHIRQQTLSIPARSAAAEWQGDEQMYRPSRFDLYQELVPTFALLSDLKLEPEQRQQVMNGLKLYWMGLEEKEATIGKLQSIF